MLLRGKTAVITGSLQGIGKAALEIFARNGADIFACCQREDEQFAEYISDLSGNCGVSITPVCFDLLDEDAVREGAKFIQKSKRSIDILINIAGANFDALFHMVTMEQLKRTFAINFFSQILFTQYITRLMLKQGSGSVVNISSITALDGNPGQLSYASSKAALIAATKTMSEELAPKGIRVNALAPGVIKTAMTDAMPEDIRSRMIARSELKRVGLPDEVAGAILYLASDLSKYVTGQVIRVDGGIG
ncbi:MAG: SDR family oxidoreductase [Synergistaceae bacterium]|jgi:3-oxoacyl-[acyl-carrier protein] reductase|nr:SDR family oxidoreductase [Synergistaceae bacterium]